MHDRFLRDPVYRDSQLKIGWTEEKCIEMDKLAQEGSFTAGGNLLQPTVCVNSTPHTSPFSRSKRVCVMMCDTTLAQVVGARHPIHVSSA